MIATACKVATWLALVVLLPTAASAQVSQVVPLTGVQCATIASTVYCGLSHGEYVDTQSTSQEIHGGLALDNPLAFNCNVDGPGSIFGSVGIWNDCAGGANSPLTPTDGIILGVAPNSLFGLRLYAGPTEIDQFGPAGTSLSVPVTSNMSGAPIYAPTYRHTGGTYAATFHDTGWETNTATISESCAQYAICSLSGASVTFESPANFESAPVCLISIGTPLAVSTWVTSSASAVTIGVANVNVASIAAGTSLVWNYDCHGV